VGNLDHARICQRLATLAEHATWRLPITAVCAALGINIRALHTICRAQFGIAPAQFLRQRRLARVRAALLAAEPADTVTDIAMRFGFDELGRFARRYAAIYGEKPSDTLARCRATLRPMQLRLPRSIGVQG